MKVNIDPHLLVEESIKTSVIDLNVVNRYTLQSSVRRVEVHYIRLSNRHLSLKVRSQSLEESFGQTSEARNSKYSLSTNIELKMSFLPFCF